MTVELNKCYNESCLETMKRMNDNFIDLVVTSPPYGDLRDYNGYIYDFKSVAKELFRILKIGGVVVWVVGDKYENGSETLFPFRQALFFKDEVGFSIHDTMIYEKTGLSFPPANRYWQIFEFMFILSKGTPKTTNLIKIATKYQKRGNEKKSCSYREQDGTTTKGASYEIGKANKTLGNIWKIETGFMLTSKDRFAFDHPAMFPEKLCEMHILSWSNEKELVYDPFLGSGTVAKMSVLNNRYWIGSEISGNYCKIIEKRISNDNLYKHPKGKFVKNSLLNDFLGVGTEK